jgi:hypothetical protein
MTSSTTICQPRDPDGNNAGETYVPSWSTIIGLCDVVVTFTVTACKQNFILDITPTLGIQRIDVVSELLPLRVVFSTLVVSWVRAIEKTKVPEGLSGDQQCSLFLSDGKLT